VTENHDETVAGVRLPFSVPLLSVNVAGLGSQVEFEGIAFNRAFTVRTSSRKFAYDVIHPRTMEYLEAVRPLPFVVQGSVMRFFPPRHDSLLLGECADLAAGLWSRVPSFVWKDLGEVPPAFTSLSRTSQRRS
jgi:hypothetical protein